MQIEHFETILTWDGASDKQQDKK